MFLWDFNLNYNDFSHNTAQYTNHLLSGPCDYGHSHVTAWCNSSKSSTAVLAYYYHICFMCITCVIHMYVVLGVLHMLFIKRNMHIMYKYIISAHIHDAGWKFIMILEIVDCLKVLYENEFKNDEIMFNYSMFTSCTTPIC